MTELATPPVEREQDVKRISHWIGGRLVEGESGRSGPVYNPAKGIQTGAVDFLSVLTNFGSVLEYEMTYFDELTSYHTAVSRLEEMTGTPVVH